MLPFRRILFPLDYSERCRAIVPYVRDMLQHFPAGLTLVHAYSLVPSFATRDSGQLLVYNELTGAALTPESTRALIHARLCGFAAEHFPGRHVDCLAEEGEPGTVIDQVVQHHGA